MALNLRQKHKSGKRNNHEDRRWPRSAFGSPATSRSRTRKSTACAQAHADAAAINVNIWLAPDSANLGSPESGEGGGLTVFHATPPGDDRLSFLCARHGTFDEIRLQPRHIGESTYAGTVGCRIDGVSWLLRWRMRVENCLLMQKLLLGGSTIACWH